LLLSQGVTAQIDFPNQVRENLTLSDGIYLVKGTSYVKKGVTLTITGSANLLFAENATIRIDGALKIQGEPNKLINITSTDKQHPGNGIVINGVSSNQDVIIEYARFDYIKKPVTFEFRWSRNSVKIINNIIKRSLYEGTAIDIKDIDNLLTPKKIYFDFKGNTFSNNTSSILISNITSDLLTIRINENVITRNEYTGRMRNGVFTSPLYMTYNNYQNNDKPSLENNSIFDNLYSLFYADTFDIGRTNVSVIGNADELSLSHNYFGDPEEREIEETFDFISANYQAPFLFIEEVKAIPPNYLNGHFYEVLVNGEELDERAVLKLYKKEVKTIELRFNRPVIDGKDFGVVYTFLRDNTIVAVPIKTRLKFSEGNQFAKVSLDEKLSKYSHHGYLELAGFYDSEGMDVPILTLGKKALQDQQLRTSVPRFITNNDQLEDFHPIENTSEEVEKLNNTVVYLRKKYWSAGAFVGNALYFGDLSRTAVGVNASKMRPNIGLRLNYQATEKFSLGFRNSYMVIAGSDNTDNNARGTSFARNLSFRTTIIDAALMVEYNFTRFKQLSSFVPSIFVGGNVYYFKPEARVNGEGQWYNLRDIGTEGQTIGGANQAYEKIMYGIPMGASIKRHLTQRTVIALSYTYNKIFTDYLDDVSNGAYPDVSDLAKVNPNMSQEALLKLSNPGNQAGQRSYSSSNDGYGYWGLTFTLKLP
jgi:hypothetical protein